MKSLLIIMSLLLIACGTTVSSNEGADGDWEYECYPGVLRCNSDSIEKCSQSGIWTEYIDCSKNGMTCLFESCVTSEDGDESEYEDGDIEEEIAGDSEETTETEIPDGDAPDGEDEQSEDEYSEEADVEESESPEESLEDLVWVDYERNLIWQKKLPMEENPENGFLKSSHAEAKYYCDVLSLAGYDDWRLPTVSEIRTIISGCENTETDGVCGVNDDCFEYSCYDSSCSCEENLQCYCTEDLPCWYEYPFGEIDVRVCESFWTHQGTEKAWVLNFKTASFKYSNEYEEYSTVRCVHDITLPSR